MFGKEFCLNVGLLHVFLILRSIQSDTCDRKSTCSCQCSQGVIDLSSLSSKDGPSFKDVKALDPYKYSYNPCETFTETRSTGVIDDNCHDVAVCQMLEQMGSYRFYDVGTQNSVTFYTVLGSNVGLPDIDYDVVVAKYLAADGVRQTEVILVCNDEDSTTAFNPLGEIETANPPYTYRMYLTSPEACFKSPSGLSGGSAFLIVMFSLLGAYVVIGVLVKKFYYKASGKDLIPNTNFWLVIPGYIKTGCCCVVKRGKIGKQYDVI